MSDITLISRKICDKLLYMTTVAIRIAIYCHAMNIINEKRPNEHRNPSAC
jgi:hypothetical protein